MLEAAQRPRQVTPGAAASQALAEEENYKVGRRTFCAGKIFPSSPLPGLVLYQNEVYHEESCDQLRKIKSGINLLAITCITHNYSSLLPVKL